MKGENVKCQVKRFEFSGHVLLYATYNIYDKTMSLSMPLDSLFYLLSKGIYITFKN